MSGITCDRRLTDDGPDKEKEDGTSDSQSVSYHAHRAELVVGRRGTEMRLSRRSPRQILLVRLSSTSRGSAATNASASSDNERTQQESDGDVLNKNMW